LGPGVMEVTKAKPIRARNCSYDMGMFCRILTGIGLQCDVPLGNFCNK
jgi:hypothetical protein